MNITTAKIAAELGIKPSTLTIGAMRDQLVQDLKDKLERTINGNQNKEDYYILVVAKMNAFNRVEEKLVLLSVKPSKLLGSMLFYVNNKTGEFRKEWVLPPDKPKNEALLTEACKSPDVRKDAEGMHIVH